MMAEKNPLLQAAENIGAILKARREDIDKSQREIAEALGYRNINFISMI
jgi:transcriptional regulator with XRE-family HTH domain